MMFLVGALDSISVVVRHTLVQMLTPDEMRGRVSAVNSVFIVASNDLGGAWNRASRPGCSARSCRSSAGAWAHVLVVLAVLRLWPRILPGSGP